MEFYSVIKKNEIMKISGKWKKLENITVSDITQMYYICESIAFNIALFLEINILNVLKCVETLELLNNSHETIIG